MTRTVPQYRPDIYTPAAIQDPYPHYARMRELGPVVWLPRHRVYALPRYAECKAALRDPETFTSGSGVALNCVTNRMSRGTTLNSDGEEHDRRRKLVAHRLTPRALRSMSAAVEQQATRIVEDAMSRRQIDGVHDLASALPLAVVPDLVGWPVAGRDQLLRWAGATFDALGPINRQSVKSIPASIEMLRYSRRVVEQRSIIDGSMGHDVLVAADAGEIGHAECPALMIDYLAPSLDTTISAISSALHLFASHPEQWDEIRANPKLIPNAVNEVVRIESPLRAFARSTSRTVEIGDTTIPRDARVLVMYASANRDELQWTDPNTFDVHRNATNQLGFGYGTHGCAGQGLARLETEAILRALAQRVERILPNGKPSWAMNNIIHRHEQLPLELVPAKENV
ncbi:cytochrome P450 [Antrihabitans sp. YC2-6]|uniref:cytochrome P450 n=1 Tax=Antrihabitans sp. YC2-6 TaxID=2799498 RepID=UPI0018F767DC|nr:cytochrome P450 [Antrihabitans sp. YC2-6]MBJ8344272.1 cytochrome P450 [Antrihabitans sp. YC2-6]